MPEPIFEAGPVATPYVYTVSGTGTVTPRDFQAVYDGTNSSGDYIPAVVLKSQAGHVIARAILQQTITKGADAEVSWFRGVKAAAASSAAAASLPTCFLDQTNGFTLNTWTPNVYTPVTWQLFNKNEATTFAWPGSGGNSTVAILRSGVYRCAYEYMITGFNFPVAPGFVLSKVTVAVAGATTEELALNHTTAALWEGNPNVGQKWSPIGERLFNFPNPGDLQLDMANTRAGSVTISTTVMFIYRVGDPVV
jgi:hypothetical protein